MMLKQLTFFILLISSLSFSQGLKTKGKIIVDENENEVLLRGYTPGGWLVMEGYMMQSEGTAGAQHEFVERFTDLVGEDRTNHKGDPDDECYRPNDDADTLYYIDVKHCETLKIRWYRANNTCLITNAERIPKTCIIRILQTPIAIRSLDDRQQCQIMKATVRFSIHEDMAMQYPQDRKMAEEDCQGDHEWWRGRTLHDRVWALYKEWKLENQEKRKRKIKRRIKRRKTTKVMAVKKKRKYQKQKKY